MRAKAATVVVSIAIAVLCMWTFAGAAEIQEPVPVPGEAVNGLQISVQPEKATYAAGEAVKFRVELRNVGDADLMLNLGMMLANGKKQLPTAIGLALADSAGGKRVLRFKEPGVAGRIDDFLVPLPKGASYALESALSDYVSLETKEFRIEPAPGQYTITASYEGKPVSFVNGGMEDVKLISLWKGRVASSAATVTVAAK